MIDFEDGETHTIGPITLRYEGIRDTKEGEPTELAVCWITTEGADGTRYALDYGYALALASAIEPLADLFSFTESDKDKERGELRFRASGATKHDDLRAITKNEVYPLGRIIMNASGNEAVDHKDWSDKSERDYRRASLTIVGNKNSKHTRKDFIEKGICARVAKRDGVEVAEALRDKLNKLFAETDALTGAPNSISYEPESNKGN